MSTPWQPRTEVGDVIVHHAAPRVWITASVTKAGDLAGTVIGKNPRTTRDSAIDAARGLLQHGGQIYIHHQDDAEWEQVRTETV